MFAAEKFTGRRGGGETLKQSQIEISVQLKNIENEKNCQSKHLCDAREFKTQAKNWKYMRATSLFCWFMSENNLHLLHKSFELSKVL